VSTGKALTGLRLLFPLVTSGMIVSVRKTEE